jgi:hypothetical protein
VAKFLWWAWVLGSGFWVLGPGSWDSVSEQKLLNEPNVQVAFINALRAARGVSTKYGVLHEDGFALHD